MNFDRYKFVAEVTICEAKGQGVRMASRCLWDTATDSCASASFKNVPSVSFYELIVHLGDNLRCCCCFRLFL
jgi:hypothetical protein